MDENPYTEPYGFAEALRAHDASDASPEVTRWLR